MQFLADILLITRQVFREIGELGGHETAEHTQDQEPEHDHDQGGRGAAKPQAPQSNDQGRQQESDQDREREWDEHDASEVKNRDYDDHRDERRTSWIGAGPVRVIQQKRAFLLSSS